MSNFDAAFAKEFSSGMVEIIQESIAPLRDRIAALEARQQGQKYCGVWEADREYHAGNFCQHKGFIWHANVRTKSMPGTDPTVWVPAVEDGKDVRSSH
jgi:hypothetical protein